ncbi:MAG: hypothetical protein ACI9U2_003674 [Bradymonadia bacterium]|jgi:hypothetical protein
MRTLAWATLLMGLFSCGELEDHQVCSTNQDCDIGYQCDRPGVGSAGEGLCKLNVGEPCVRPAECVSAQCNAGFCR